MALIGAWATVQVQVGRDALVSAAFDPDVPALKTGAAVAVRLARLTVGESEPIELAEGAFRFCSRSA
jgi:hypothetical protein